ncbi:MAG: PAS domain-containing sensor histidine kinase [Planctomycetota bacterium]
MDYSEKQLLIDSNDTGRDGSQLEQQLGQTEKQLHASEEAWSNSIKKLKRSRREFLTIFDSVPAVIWYRDREGKILRVNQCAADSVGRSKNELIGKNYYELFPDGAHRSRQQDLEVIESGRPLCQQLRQFKSFDGTIRWAVVDRIPLNDKKAGAIIGVMVFAQDITEKKIAEDQLISAKKEIEIRNEQLKAYANEAEDSARQAHLSNKAKSEILASSSHDLRTPMNAIIGFSNLLRDTEIDDEQIEYVEMINKSANGLLSLINDILDYSKLEAGKLNIQVTDCNVSDFIREMEATMAPGARQKGLDFNVQIDSEIPETFPTDPVRLKQCMINLIGNAIKFTKKGHIMINVRPVSKDGQPCIQFSVEDTGVGIAKDKQELIFKAYSQAESTTDRVFGGTGLGLSITKKLTNLLGGHISITSEPEKGSVFSIILPLNPKENK